MSKKEFPAKKLPGILKKIYPADKIEKKLYKKIYIPSDLELLKSQFVPHPEKQEKVFIPRDKILQKNEFKRLKQIAKDIRKQKASFKLIPFIATAAFIAAATIVVISFKNVIVKKGITNAMQSAFGAKTDIDSVNVELLGASITIRGLEQANKNSPMKNLFQADTVEINFNLTEALRGKFDAENIELSGFEINTDRKTSGELPEKKKEQKEEEKSESIDFTEQGQTALNAAKNSVQDMFADYNPQTILNNLEENLKSPALAVQVQEEIDSLVSKWKDKPEEIETSIKELNAGIKDVMDIDWGNIQNQDINEIKTNIELITDAVEKSKALKESVQDTVNNVKSDSTKIKNISSEIKDAVSSDTQLINKQFSNIKSFKIPAGSKILGNILDSVFYSLIGEYYTYIKQASEYALELKEASKGTKTTQVEKIKKETKSRSAGTDIYWKKDRVPSFLIERINFSGLNLAITGTDISNNMDKREAPAEFTGNYSSEKQIHKADLTVDTRSITENPLVKADYSGNNYPLRFSTPYLSMDSSAVISAEGNITDTGAVILGINLNTENLSLSTESFEPEFAFNLYNKALSYVTDITVQTNVSFNNGQKFSLNVNSDLDEKFLSALKKTADAELSDIISKAKTEISLLLDEKTEPVREKISQFTDIEDKINVQNMNMENLNSSLEEKKAELQEQLKKKTEEAAGKVLKNAVESVQQNQKASDAIKKGSSTLKGLLNKN